jgi:hypothetical protein
VLINLRNKNLKPVSQSRELIYAVRVTNLNMSASTTIPVVATETAITALIEGQRSTSYDDFKIALENWEIADNFTARLGKSEIRCVTHTGAVGLNAKVFYLYAFKL